MKKLLAISTAAILAGAVPLAASADDAGTFYVGAGIGNASFKSAEFLTDFGNDTFGDDDVAYRVFVGYQITEAVGVELGYQDWGKLKDTEAFTGFAAQIEPTVFDVVAVGRAPLGDTVTIYGKAGVAFLSADTMIDDGEGGTFSSTTVSQDLTFGGGFEFKVGSFGIRVEADWVDVEDSDQAVVYGLYGVYNFGD